ncbi:hypothetical protein ID866_9006 [Astraeus odoratus]|nr:hypothetical protein ID866_9006 [Astraeus odoratus]
MAQGGITREEVIKALNQRWAGGQGGAPPVGKDNGVWDPIMADPQRLLHQGSCAPAHRNQTPQWDTLPPGLAVPANPAEAVNGPVEDTAITFDADTQVASTLQSRPVDYALKRLETFKFVPMWYFTREGLCEAARTVCQSDESKMLAITQASEGNLTMHAANSLTTLKNAKLDHQLTYGEYMFTKNHFLVAIENARWGNKVIDASNWFFHNLDNHPWHKEGPQGEHALLLYALQVCQDWHGKLALKQAYNIEMISEDLLDKISQELDKRDIRVGIDQVNPHAKLLHRVC